MLDPKRSDRCSHGKSQKLEGDIALTVSSASRSNCCEFQYGFRKSVSILRLGNTYFREIKKVSSNKKKLKLDWCQNLFRFMTLSLIKCWKLSLTSGWLKYMFYESLLRALFFELAYPASSIFSFYLNQMKDYFSFTRWRKKNVWIMRTSVHYSHVFVRG